MEKVANDFMDVLMDVDMEPSFNVCGGRALAQVEDNQMDVGSGENSLEMPFVEEFDLLGCQFRRNGKGVQGRREH